MKLAEFVNLIFRKLGHRVHFDALVKDENGRLIAEITHGPQRYLVSASWMEKSQIEVRHFLECGDLADNTFSRWVSGILNGLVRDEEGNMVPACHV